MDTIYLSGSEQVSRAGHQISGAAELMQRASSSIEGSVERLERIASRFEEAAKMFSDAVDRYTAEPTMITKETPLEAEPYRCLAISFSGARCDKPRGHGEPHVNDTRGVRIEWLEAVTR